MLRHAITQLSRLGKYPSIVTQLTTIAMRMLLNTFYHLIVGPHNLPYKVKIALINIIANKQHVSNSV